MKFFIVLFLIIKFAQCKNSTTVIKHPFVHIGDFEVENESVKKYFYSGDIHASWAKAVELCELFEMKLVTFKNEQEDKSFREKFSSSTLR